MSKHTPGPWSAWIEGQGQEGGHAHEVVVGKHFASVASVPFSSRGTTALERGATNITKAQAIANARLIAAAPDLLLACRQAEQWLAGWASAEPYISKLRQAIEKATGETA